MSKLPIYELFIDDDLDSGVSMVSLVDRPAIEVSWIALNEQKEVKFATISEEKRIIFGALLIPDKEIFRRDDETGEEFYVKFTKQGIYNIRERFMKNRYTSNTNPQHDENIVFDDVFMVETYLKDSTMGVYPPEQFNNLPDGTWFAAFKVDNDEVWNDYVKTGVFTGFSIEGQFKSKKIELNKTNMSKFTEGLTELITKFFGEQKTETKLMEAKLSDGTTIKVEPKLEVGAAVLIVTDEGDVAAFDATHEIEDGTQVTTVAGLISAIEAPSEKEEEAPSAAKELEPLLAAVTERFNSQINELKASVEAVTKENETLKTKLSETSTENKGLKDSLDSFIIELKALPADDKPLEAVNTATVKETAKQRAIRMAATIQELKTKK